MNQKITKSILTLAATSLLAACGKSASAPDELNSNTQAASTSEPVAGPKGDKGDTGEVGHPGAPGAAGIQGIQGIDGPQGPQGSQGVKGDKGDAGSLSSVQIQGATDVTEVLRTTEGELNIASYTNDTSTSATEGLVEMNLHFLIHKESKQSHHFEIWVKSSSQKAKHVRTVIIPSSSNQDYDNISQSMILPRSSTVWIKDISGKTKANLKLVELQLTLLK